MRTEDLLKEALNSHQENCAKCNYFVIDEENVCWCDLGGGIIEPDGYCSNFSKKEG